MTIDIDHIFIFTNDHGKIADELVQFGLTEGSSRVHVGQGTTNRKFYFDNFFLEILWVHNEEEIKSARIKPTGLWQRADPFFNSSPYGLCIVNQEESDKIFEKAIQYQPAYFPMGMTIDILKNEQNLHLPWTFRLPFKDQKKNDHEPTEHTTKISHLTSVEFGVVNLNDNDEFVRLFSGQTKIKFTASSKHYLALTFDYHQNGLTKEFEKISLQIRY